MSKNVTFGNEAMTKMMIGLNKTADAVGSTLGPKGKNVFLDGGIPRITNDGATIANEIVLEDKLENAGAYIVRNTSSETNDNAGDGTTTTTVLLQAIIQESLKRPENAMEIRESLKKAGDSVLKILEKKAIKIEKKDIEQVALISAEDKQLAKLITEIVNKLGDKAVINVEDSKTFATDYEIVDGYEAHVGFMSPTFITDKKSSKAIYQDVPVLVSEKKISNVTDISPVFEMFKKEGISSCVIVCDDIDDAMLGMLVVNNNMGNFKSLVIRASSLLLEDIAGATGAQTISNHTGISFANFEKEYLGYAKKVVCDANKTLFIGDGIASKRYAKDLEAKANTEPNMYTARNMKQRVAKLNGGIAVLRIGASTDFDREYLKFKAEDAVKATLAALEEGIVEGGGMTLWRIANNIKANTIGEEILKKALTAPLRKIIENAGKDYAEIIKDLPEGKGYDAKNDCYVDMIKEGIIDPAKVERCAIENSVSAASQFITTGAVITEYEDKK